MSILRDRAGSVSGLKVAALALACAPALWIAAQGALGLLGKRPITGAIHQTGEWTLWLLLATLLVTPLRRLADWPSLILVRRTIGIACACYAGSHLALYVVDQKFDLAKVASEIALRFYLTVGFLALAALVALGATSNDAMVARLGSDRWNRLHRLVYPATALGLFHFFQQSKIDVTRPVILSGLFLLLMGHRLLRRRGWALATPGMIVLAALGALGTAGIEWLWYRLATGIDPWRVLAANLDFSYAIRPMWWVFAAGLLAAAMAALRQKPPRRHA